jgi:Phosphotransferase enzyme family
MLIRWTLPEAEIMAAVTDANHRTGNHWSVGERSAGGLVGCHFLAGEPAAVLKMLPPESPIDPEAMTAATGASVSALRRVGYPAPDVLASGQAVRYRYLVLQRLQGTSGGVMTAARRRALLALNELQAGLGSELLAQGVPDRSRTIHQELYDPDWTERLAPSQPQSAATFRELVQTVSEFVAPFREQRLPSTDFVHCDVKSDNILWASPDSDDPGYTTIAGVVDFDQAHAGTRASDLMMIRHFKTADRPALGYLSALLRQRVRGIVGHAGLLQLAAHNVLLSPVLLERLQYSTAEISARATPQLGALHTIADNNDPPLPDLEARLANDTT